MFDISIELSTKKNLLIKEVFFVTWWNVVYILNNKKYDKIDIGFVSNLFAKFRSHNDLGTKGWTKWYRPLEVILVYFYKFKWESI